MNLWTELFDSSGLPSIAYLLSIAYRYVIISIWKNVFFRDSIRMRANLRTEFAGWFGLSDIAYRSSMA